MFGKHIYLGLESLKKRLCPGSTPCSLGLSGGGMKQEGLLLLQSWKPKGGYQSEFAPTFDLEARPLTSTQTHGQGCPPLVQPTNASMFFQPRWRRRVWYNKKMDFGVKETWVWILSLQLISCVTMDKCFFSLSLKLSSPRGKRIPRRVIGKNKSYEITYVK